MAINAGIVGLPNVGKSTLFNAITKKNILVANYPFATIDPNVGTVIVPDERLAYLEEMYIPTRCIPTVYEFTDIAGLVKGASKGEGLGNKFLSHIREVDAIVEVVRCFDDENVIHVNDTVDPIRDIEVINVELVLSDLEIVEGRFNRLGKKVDMTKDKQELFEIGVLKKVRDGLMKNIPVRKIGLDSDEIECIKSFNLITLKPVIYVANVGEDEVVCGNEYEKMVHEYAQNEGNEAVTICCKIESELAELNDTDKIEFLKDLGIPEAGLDLLVKKTYSLLGLATFFTVGSDEVRAWTFKKGMKAPQCAGLIHTDFERGFIRAEVTSYTDLVKYGSDKAVKDNGKVRLEGKDYEMQDGDICYFRFNV